MSIFSRIKDQRAASRIEEEVFYAAAIHEIENGGRRSGLWAKALANAGGSESAAKALYLKLLVQKLKDEAHISNRLREQKSQELARQEQERRQNAERDRFHKALREKQELQKKQSSTDNKSNVNSPIIMWSVVLIGILLILFLVLIIPVAIDPADTVSSEELESSLMPPNSSSDQLGSSEEVYAPPRPEAVSEFDRLVNYIEDRYPRLNPNHGDFDQLLVNRVIERQKLYANQNYNNEDSLLLAVHDYFGDLLSVDEMPGATDDTEESDGSLPECEYKGVMTNEDYRNCGLEPPQ